jgi:hypothetical protein
MSLSSKSPRTYTAHPTLPIPNRSVLLGIVVIITTAMLILCATAPTAADRRHVIEHGKHLVNLGGCHDCHLPGYF